MRIGTISKPQAFSLLSPTFRKVAISQDREGTRGGAMGARGAVCFGLRKGENLGCVQGQTDCREPHPYGQKLACPRILVSLSQRFSTYGL